MRHQQTDNNEQYWTANCKEILYPFYIYYLWSVLFVYLITVGCIYLNLHHSLASLSGLHLVIAKNPSANIFQCIFMRKVQVIMLSNAMLRLGISVNILIVQRGGFMMTG